MKKQQFWIQASLDLITEQSLEWDYLTDAEVYVIPVEGFFFTPEQLVAKLKEAWQAGYDRCMAEMTFPNPTAYASGEGDFINEQNIEL